MRLSGAVSLACVVLLAGCALHSDKPLIAANAPAPGITDGRYQAYGAFGPDKLAQLSAAQRALCLDLGFRAAPPEPEAWTPVAVVHCPFNDSTLAPTSIAQLSRLTDRYQLTGANAQGKTEAVHAWLQLLRAPYYLVQVHAPESQLKGYFYGIARFDAGRIAVYMVPCATEGLKTADAPEPKLQCEITSLAAIQRDLLAETQRIDAGAADPPAILAPPAVR